MENATAHRVELLEAEIRKYRQALRILAEAAIAGSDQTVPLALAAENMLNDG
jgi:hypothetical protein